MGDRYCKFIRRLSIGGELWMFDVGEGTVRHSLNGPKSTTETSRVFITHLHADHIYGLPSLMLHAGMTSASPHPEDGKRSAADEDLRPIMIYGPQGTILITDHRYCDTVMQYRRSRHACIAQRFSIF
jgi:ribonuclease BN (tRNA processing enzyme)